MSLCKLRRTLRSDVEEAELREVSLHHLRRGKRCIKREMWPNSEMMVVTRCQSPVILCDPKR